MVVRLNGYIVVPDADRDIICKHLPEHIRLTLAEKGCVSFSVTPDPENPERYLVAEVFSDQESFDLHQSRVKESVWGAATKHLKRHYKITEG